MQKAKVTLGLLLCALFVGAPPARGDLVPVRHLEGRTHGFLTLRDLDDRVLAVGDLTQLADGGRVTSTLRLHFNDGSLHDETAEFSQRRYFRLLAYHLVQKGPAFPRQLEMTVNVASGQVVIRYADAGEETKEISEHWKLPPDLANGLVTTLLADLGELEPGTPAPSTPAKTTLSLLAATPKPRLVKLEITPAGEAPFALAGSPLSATRYQVHVEIGGLAGAVAPLVGKQPPDTHIWMIGGKVPGFLKSEGPLFQGGPVWRIELASPTWPKEAAMKP